MNDALNGVFLAKNSKVRNLVGGAVHSKIHTAKYYIYVEKEVIKAWKRGGTAEVEKTLRRIGRMLERGKKFW